MSPEKNEVIVQNRGKPKITSENNEFS